MARSTSFLLAAALMLSVVALASANGDDDKCYSCPANYGCYKHSHKDSSKCWSSDYCYFKCDKGRQCDDGYRPSWCSSNDKTTCKDKNHCYFRCPDWAPHCKAGECYGNGSDDRKCSSQEWCYHGSCKSQGKKCKNPCGFDDGHGSFCKDDKCH